MKKNNGLERKNVVGVEKVTTRSKTLVLEGENRCVTANQPRNENPKTLPSLGSINCLAERKNRQDEIEAIQGASNQEEVKDHEKSEAKLDKADRIKLPIYPNLTNMKEFRKKHKLDEKTKVYIVTGGYGDIKKALDKRGWVQNLDPKSRCFDLRWTIKSKEDDIQYLEESQMVNHFERNATITSKVGLCHNLRNLVWFSNVDIDTFFPKCYDLSEEKDYDDFIEEFKHCKAESILKQFMKLNSSGENSLIIKCEETINTAIQVLERKLRNLDEVLDEHDEIISPKVTEEEWKILSKDEITNENFAKKKFEARLGKYETMGKPKKNSKKKSKRRIIDAKALRADKESSVQLEKDSLNDLQAKDVTKDLPDEVNGTKDPKHEELLRRITSILEKLKEKYPQDGLIGEKNIWMLKPGGLSRGRGITALKDLVEILDVARKNANQWVVQKYIENPLIIHKRKFDIRQWVLVTDWNPLTVWFYEECYVRFSGGEYDADDLENRYIHLTNNSVIKHAKTEDDPRFEQNMWMMEIFANHLKDSFGYDVFNEKIKPQMKKAVVHALESVQDMVGSKKNCFELYGYDFMVDENFNVWLIEINLSPAMDYSTPVTKRLVKMVSEDVIRVVVDYNGAKKKQKANVSTGLFTRIHKSKRCVDKPANSYGLDLVCEGYTVGKSETV